MCERVCTRLHCTFTWRTYGSTLLLVDQNVPNQFYIFLQFLELGDHRDSGLSVVSIWTAILCVVGWGVSVRARVEVGCEC